MCAFFYGELKLVPGIELSRLAWSEAYLHTKWHLDPCSRLATVDMRQKLGALPLFVERAGYPSNPKSPGLMPTSIPSVILMHPAVWPQQKCAENSGGGLAPFWGRGAGSPSNTVAWAEAYLHTKWHLDPSSHLSTTDMGRKLGALSLWGRGSWVPT